jgi:cell division protein FtsB
MASTARPRAPGAASRPRVSQAPPRRASRPAPRSRIRWDRVGRAALAVFLAVIVALYVPPVSSLLTQSQTAERQRAELEQLRQERRELRARKAALEGPQAIELQARRLGMVREDEKALAIEGLPER